MTRAQAVLKMLADAAKAGVRCPTNSEIHDAIGTLPFSDSPAQLAREGLCRIEIYGKNWRVVEVDGKRSAECPHRHNGPYRVIEKGTPTFEAVRECRRPGAFW